MLSGKEKESLTNWFTYHPPKDYDISHFTAIRNEGRQLAEIIMQHAPDGEEKQIALQKVREAVMWANAAIACDPVSRAYDYHPG